MTHPDTLIRHLEQNFRESRERVWQDESIPLPQRREEVDRLWRELEAQRAEIRSGAPVQEAQAPPRPALGSLIPRRRRRPWK